MNIKWMQRPRLTLSSANVGTIEWRLFRSIRLFLQGIRTYDLDVSLSTRNHESSSKTMQRYDFQFVYSHFDERNFKKERIREIVLETNSNFLIFLFCFQNYF